MKKIIFDTNPMGNFSFSCRAYYEYYKKKFNRKIYFYIREKDSYIRIDNIEDADKFQNRIITFCDFGKCVEEIPFDDNRVKIIDESYEEDEILLDIVESLGDKASWKDSKLKIVLVEE